MCVGRATRCWKCCAGCPHSTGRPDSSLLGGCSCRCSPAEDQTSWRSRTLLPTCALPRKRAPSYRQSRATCSQGRRSFTPARSSSTAAVLGASQELFTTRPGAQQPAAACSGPRRPPLASSTARSVPVYCPATGCPRLRLLQERQRPASTEEWRREARCCSPDAGTPQAVPNVRWHCATPAGGTRPPDRSTSRSENCRPLSSRCGAHSPASVCCRRLSRGCSAEGLRRGGGQGGRSSRRRCVGGALERRGWEQPLGEPKQQRLQKPTWRWR